jgi:hypothetical protein
MSQAQAIEINQPMQQLPSIQLEKTAEQLDLAPMKLQAPIYKLRKFTQISGGNTLNLSTSPTQSIFNISGNSVWNFSRSYLTFDALFAAPAAGALALFTDCLPVDSVQLLFDGRVLAEVSNAQLYSKVIQAMATDLDDYNTRGPVYGDTLLNTAYPLSQVVGCQPVGGYTASTRTTLQNLLNRPSDNYTVDNGANPQVMTFSASPATHQSGSDVAGRFANQRLITGGATAAVQLRYKVALKVFVGTILSLDKDLFFGQNLQLVINWSDYRAFGFSSTVTCGDPAEIAAAPAITKYQLYMAEDVNDFNREVLMSQVKASGINIVVPYTYCKPITIAANSTNGTNSQPLTKGMGICLKRAITVPSIANAVSASRNNTFNVGGVKFTTVQSTLDGKPLQDQKLVLADSDVWNYMRDLIKRSPAGLSQRTHEENCFFLDNFSDCYDSTKFYENDCYVSGLTIDGSQKTYEVNIEKAAGGAITLTQYQTWSKMLVIRPDSISWGSQ